MTDKAGVQHEVTMVELSDEMLDEVSGGSVIGIVKEVIDTVGDLVEGVLGAVGGIGGVPGGGSDGAAHFLSGLTKF